MKRSAIWYLLAAGVLVLDQWSKIIILDWPLLAAQGKITVTPFFNWVLTWNPGAAFSFLAGAGGWQRWLFVALALGISVWIALEIHRHPGEKWLCLALSLVMGGALGNVLDRLRFGVVLDFIQLHAAGFYWPAFNLADAAITAGALLLLGAALRGSRLPKKGKP
ncbi:MAG: signal peptidase II [Betaproteobacteria bacterium]|nr:signal peptidase II [Betaproteobacteria bacterium]